MASTSSPATRKRCYMDVVLGSSDHQSDETEELTERVSFKRSKSGESSLRVLVRASSPSRGATSQPCSPVPDSITPTSAVSSPSSSKSARPNMSASQTITLDMLRPHFEKPLAQVAQVFGICVTLLKKICRKNGLARWPHRQIIGLRKSIASMEQAIGHFEGARRDSYAQQLDKQRNKLLALLEDPTKCNLLAIDDEYTSPSLAAVDEHVQGPVYLPKETQALHYAAQALPPTYGRSYAPQAGYYHAPPPPSYPQPVMYLQHHNYPAPYSHPTAALLPQASPMMTLPPLRIDNRQPLPSLSALVGRRW